MSKCLVLSPGRLASLIPGAKLMIHQVRIWQEQLIRRVQHRITFGKYENHRNICKDCRDKIFKFKGLFPIFEFKCR